VLHVWHGADVADAEADRCCLSSLLGGVGLIDNMLGQLTLLVVECAVKQAVCPVVTRLKR
jgi:hypothetical protein